MNGSTNVRSLGLLWSLAAFMLSGCKPTAEEWFRSQAHINVPQNMLRCATVVDQYVATKKGWPPSDYKVTVERATLGVALFRVSYIDDFRGRDDGRHGAGTSVLVEVDCRSTTVLREERML